MLRPFENNHKVVFKFS